MAAGGPRPSDAWIQRFVGGIGVLPFGGLILFLTGLGLVGWLHSRTLGIITTLSAALGLAIVIYVLRAIAAL